MTKNLVVVIYDSILNSVFRGQVLEPIINKLKTGLYTRVCIISFEQNFINQDTCKQISSLHPNLSLIIVKRWVFIHPWCLFFQIRTLKRLLTTLDSYDIIARGALSGFLALKALDTKRCTNLIIQARGLLAQEYRYEHRNSSQFLRPIYNFRAWCYECVERETYANKPRNFAYTIEVVSAALEKYIITFFGADRTHITLAHEDIPAKIAPDQIKKWRAKIRVQLGIGQQARVYCFSGAIKSWQNPLPVINYFLDCYQKDPTCFLLVLTPSVDFFSCALKQHLPAHTYMIFSVSYEHMYEYLAAADVGLILREPGIISWIARPVKAMEYEAAGLTIVHNNTVDWLVQRYGVSREFQL